MRKARGLIEDEATVNGWPGAQANPFRVALETLRRLVEADSRVLKRALEVSALSYSVTSVPCLISGQQHYISEQDLKETMSQLLMLTEKWIGRLPSGGHDAQTCLKLLETVAAEPTYQGFFVSIIPSILLALPVCIRQEEDKQCLGTLLRVLLNV